MKPNDNNLIYILATVCYHANLYEYPINLSSYGG